MPSAVSCMQVNGIHFRIAVFLSLILSFVGCKKNSPPSPDPGPGPASAFQQTDFVYGSDQKQKTDIFFAANRTDTTPLAVLHHGGGWYGGDKTDLAIPADYFYSHGINVVNMNYRLTDATANSVRAPDLLEDVDKMIQLLHDSAKPWRIRPSGYVFFGFSAGAHLALLYSYAKDPANLTSAVIGLGSPTRLDDQDWMLNPYFFVAVSALPRLTGEPWPDSAHSALLMNYSPYYAAKFKPTFLMWGEKDETVPPSQSQLMIARLNQAGTPNAGLPLPNGGHDGSGASPADADSMYTRSEEWIRAYSH